MGGAYFAASGVDPTVAVACDVTFATDYPGVDTNKHGDIKLEGGPVLAKGAPINRKMNALLEKAAIKQKIGVQYELTPAMTGTDADKMRRSEEHTSELQSRFEIVCRRLLDKKKFN